MIRWRKRGGIWFVRLGSYQVTISKVTKRPMPSGYFWVWLEGAPVTGFESIKQANQWCSRNAYRGSMAIEYWRTDCQR